jgi:hypothetical protein
LNGVVEISDCGRLRLEPDEQVTFVSASGKEHDFTAKSWGFYATPSVNARLAEQGFKTALVRNHQGRFYVMVVEREKLSDFLEYLKREQNEVEEWLDERKAAS